MSVPLSYTLFLSAILFTIGLVGVLIRRNVLIVLMSVELMLNAANLVFVAYSKEHLDLTGHLFAFFVIAVAAAEVAVGLAIVINVFRHFRTTDLDDVRTLKG